MSDVKTIGFFGDSFCMNVEYPGPTTHETYIKKLHNHYGARIVATGQGGSSIYDLFLIQLKPFLDYLIPDVCVLVWTTPDRLFHRTIRNINIGSALNNNNRYVFKNKTIETDVVWNAAEEYYKHLMDFEVTELQYISFLRYMDQIYLPTIADKTKIIHLFSYGTRVETRSTPYYTFKTGMQINPPLLNLSQAGVNYLVDEDLRPNHLEGTYKNQLLFETIRDAIDNYEPGKVLRYIIDKERIKDEQTTI